jgi:hypothetical protein
MKARKSSEDLTRASTTGTVPKKNALRKFKRAELEVSEKIGKGAYGGVWQATVLDTKQVERERARERERERE